MAVTVLTNPESFLVRSAQGTTKRLAIGYLAGPASYSTGGFACDPATDFGITGTIDKVFVVADNGVLGAYWDSGNKKILAYKALNTEADAVTNFSTAVFAVFIVYHD